VTGQRAKLQCKTCKYKSYLTEKTGSDRTDALKIGFGFFDVVIFVSLFFIACSILLKIQHF
jgi:hypothetical protein